MNLIARLLIVFLFALTACNSGEERIVPNDIIGSEKMVLIMTDMHLVEGAKIGRKIMGDTLLIDDYYHKVFEKYDITKEGFEKSFSFYSEEPEEMDEIYVKVIENLNQMQKNAPKWNESQNQDSTRFTQRDSSKISEILDSTKTDSTSETRTVADTTLTDSAA